MCRAAAAAAEQAGLIQPHGGALVDLMLPTGEKKAAIDSCTCTIELSDRNACDVELLTVGYVASLYMNVYMIMLMYFYSMVKPCCLPFGSTFFDFLHDW